MVVVVGVKYGENAKLISTRPPELRCISKNRKVDVSFEAVEIRIFVSLMRVLVRNPHFDAKMMRGGLWGWRQ